MFVGLDLGTSGLRGILVDATGQQIAEATSEYSVVIPHEGWSEQNPNDWLKACLSVMLELCASAPEAYARVKGIGISGHMHGAVMLDSEGQVVRPCILWNDVRASKEAANLDGDPNFREISGNIVFPGFAAPKLEWIAKHEPAVFAKIAMVMLPKDYLVYWLTGNICTDMSDASGTSWLNVENRNWSKRLVEASSINHDQLPKLFEGSDVVGEIDANIKDQLKFAQPVKVVAGGADNACAACGIGALKEGQGFVSLGTSGVVLVAKDKYVAKPESAVHTFCHAVPDRWYQMGVILSATDCLNWLADNLHTDPKSLSAMLPSSASGPSSVMFLPYLSGERTPHNDAEIRGGFIGLSKTADNQALTQAVMEGVAFALRDCLDALRATGSNPKSLIAIGGGSKSDFWISTLANTLGITIDVPKNGDFGAAMGAARLAMIGTGGMSVDATLKQPEIAYSVGPDPVLVSEYEASHLKFKNLYAVLKESL